MAIINKEELLEQLWQSYYLLWQWADWTHQNPYIGIQYIIYPCRIPQSKTCGL